MFEHTAYYIASVGLSFAAIFLSLEAAWHFKGNGHQNHWFGGHQDAGNHGVTQPVDRLHHLSNGVPMVNAESSDDDE